MEPELVISHSQLGTWNKCRLAYHLSYVRNWTTKESKSYFIRGIEIHKILASYYKGIKNGTWELGDPTAVKVWMNDVLSKDEVPYEMVDQVSWLLQRYIIDFSVFEDKGIQILAVEQELGIDFETPKGRLVTLHGILDLLKQINGKQWLVDHKSASNASFWSDNQVLMDSQMPTYQALLNRHGYDIFGCELNFLNTYEYRKRDQIDSSKLFKRVRTYRTEVETANVLLEFGKACDDIIDNRSNVRRSLSKDCERCVFFDPCMLSMKGMEIEELMPAHFKQKGQELGELISDSEEASSFSGANF